MKPYQAHTRIGKVNHKLSFYCMNPDNCKHKKVRKVNEVPNGENRAVQECGNTKRYCELRIPLRV